jgi:hypothetical protein
MNNKTTNEQLNNKGTIKQLMRNNKQPMNIPPAKTRWSLIRTITEIILITITKFYN